MANSTRNTLHVSPLADADQIRYYEFLCQASFRSVDLHVKRAWGLASEEQEKAFGTLADTLEGPIVYSLLSAEEIIGPADRWKETLREGELYMNWRGVEFPVGTVPRPVRGESHMYLLVRVALGRATQAKTGAARFPEGFSSCLASSSGPSENDPGSPSRSSSGNWWHTYLIKNGDQVLPTAMLDVVFEPMRISTSKLLCDMCERREAVVYCKNDNSHFCAGCDAEHHTENEFFARHQRFPLSHSPLQFGFCKHHPSERYESLCLECSVLLCPHCLVIGPHADQDHSGHSIISTIDGFRRAMEHNSESCKALDARRTGLKTVLYERHTQLTDVHSSFEEAQQQLDVSLRQVLEQLSRAQARRVEFLQSVKRQVLSQMLFLQWLENFQNHARLALPASDYLVSARRHEHAVTALFKERATARKDNSSGDIGPMPPWMEEDLTVEGALTVWLISAPNAEPDSPNGGRFPASYIGGVNPLERGMMLEAAMGAPAIRGGVGAGPNVVPSGPGLFDIAAAPTGMLGFSDEGTAYLEAAPRGGAKPAAGGYQMDWEITPHGAGGPSDTMYARGPSSPTTSPGKGGGKGKAAGEFDSFIASALAYLDTAEQRITDGRTGQMVSAPGAAPQGGSSGTLVLSTEVLVEIRAGGEAYGGPPGQWGCLLTLLTSCPSTERNELMLKALTASAPFGDASAQLARRVVEDDVRRAQFPSLLASAHGLHASLVHAMMRLEGKAGFLDPELGVLIREVKSIPPHLDAAAVSVAMHRATADFIATLSRLARAGEGRLPTSLQTLSHYLYAAAEEKFGILAAQNSVATLLVSRIITPSLLRVAQRRDADVGGPGLTDRVSTLSRLLQRIAHFAHHDEEGSNRGQLVEDAVLRHISNLRELVSRLLVLPSYPTLGISVAAEDAEQASAWLVSAARRWSAGIAASGQGVTGEAGRASHSLAAASKRLAQLQSAAASNQQFSSDLDAASARALQLHGAYNEAMTVYGAVGGPNQAGPEDTAPGNRAGGGRDFVM